MSPKYFILILMAPLLLLGAVQEEEPEEPKEEEKVSANLEIPPDLPEEARVLFEEAKATYDEAFAERAGATDLMEKAISQLHRARRKAKRFHLPYYYLGIACQITYEFDDAERHLKKAISLRKGFHEAMAELGDTYFWKRNWKKSIDLHTRAIETDPEYAYAYERRAASLAREREFEKALEDVEKCIELEKDEKKKKGLEQLKKMLVQETDETAFEGFFREETKHYILITNTSQEVAEEMADHAELIFKLYTSRFPDLDKGAEKFPIIYFKSADDYHAYGAPRGTGGYYSPFVRKFVLFDSGNQERNLIVLYHEAFHQYLHHYLEGGPQWFNEGHADFFGACRKVEGKKEFDIKPNPMRLKLIQAALQREVHAPLSKLITMTRGELYDRRRIGLNYAQSWSFVYFLWNYPKKAEGVYFPVLAKYFKELRAGRGLQEAYDRTFGREDMEKVESEWRGFILNLSGNE